MTPSGVEGFNVGVLSSSIRKEMEIKGHSNDILSYNCKNFRDNKSSLLDVTYTEF